MLSGVFVIVAVYIALEDADLNDPKLGTAIYGKLIMWQAWLLWQALPAFVLGVYTDKITSTAVICGMLTGIIVQIVLYVHGVGNTDKVTIEAFGKTYDAGALFNTRFFPEDVNNYKLDSNIISSFCNVAVCLLVAVIQSVVSTVSTAASAKAGASTSF
jgi:Na+/proline symporter